MPRRTMTFLGPIVAALTWISIVAPAHAQPWTWTNQYGSTLVVAAINGGTGQLTGTYTNNVTGSCDAGKSIPMTGWLANGSNGTAISFAVNWVGCGSTTIWTGQLNSSSGFQGLWLLSVAAPAAWNDVNAGADTFAFTNGDKAKLRTR